MVRKLLAVVAVVAVSALGCAGSDSGSDNPQATPDNGSNEIKTATDKPKCRAKVGTKDCSSQAARAKAISREVFALKDMLDPGMHDFARGSAKQSGEPMELVKMWLRHNNKDDLDLVKDFKLDASLKDLPADVQVAGLFTSADKAVDLSVASIDGFMDSQGLSISKKAKEHLVNLKNLGVVFGSDGFQQNGCAAPTQFLLVIDTAGKTVDGIDLNPCSES